MLASQPGMLGSIQVECGLVKFSYTGHDGLYFQSLTATYALPRPGDLRLSKELAKSTNPFEMRLEKTRGIGGRFSILLSVWQREASRGTTKRFSEEFPFWGSLREVYLVSAHFAVEFSSSEDASSY